MIVSKDGRRIGEVGLLDWQYKIGAFALPRNMDIISLCKLDVIGTVSLFAYPSLGYWCLSCFPMLFYSTRGIARQYSELKSCSNECTKYVTNEDLEMRLNMFLADYLSTMPAAMTNEGKARSESSVATINHEITDDRVRAIVKEVLKIYDADKTGRVDYALESAGGQIVSTRCTQRYDIKTRVFKLLAFTLYHENNNPRTVIQGNPIQPGICWAFQGFPGYLLIKLRSSIYVTGFTLEHAPKSILPNEEMRSAPKKFNVWGFLDENDLEPVMFGDYEFAASDDSLQYFPVQNTTIDRSYEYVELRIHSNHGELEYTCLYRFRVHGRPV